MEHPRGRRHRRTRHSRPSPSLLGHFAVTGDGIYLLDVDATPRPTIVYYSFQTRRLLACPALSRILRMWEASTPTAIRTCLPWWSLVEAPGSSPGTKAGPTDRTLLP